MNRLRKSLFLQPEDVQVSTIAPGTVCVTLSEQRRLYQRLSPAALLKFSISSSLPVPLPPGLCHTRAPPPPAAQRRGHAARYGPSRAGRPRSLSPWLLSLSPPLPRQPGPPTRPQVSGAGPLSPPTAGRSRARCEMPGRSAACHQPRPEAGSSPWPAASRLPPPGWPLRRAGSSCLLRSSEL